jgi:hypothetical protein
MKRAPVESTGALFVGLTWAALVLGGVVVLWRGNPGNALLTFLVGSSHRDLFKVVGLVVELHGDMLQGRGVLTRVVGTKKEFASRRKHGT